MFVVTEVEPNGEGDSGAGAVVVVVVCIYDEGVVASLLQNDFAFLCLLIPAG